MLELSFTFAWIEEIGVLFEPRGLMLSNSYLPGSGKYIWQFMGPPGCNLPIIEMVLPPNYNCPFDSLQDHGDMHQSYVHKK